MSQAGVANLGAIPPPPGSVTDIEGQDSVVVAPDGSGIIHVQGQVVAAGSTPFTTSGSGNTETWSIQRSQAMSASNATKVGLAAFNSGDFTVDSNGYVSLMPAGVGGLGVYGDGSDGAQTFDGSSVVLGITPSSSTYTLTRDIYLSDSTINNGVTINANNFRIFCNGILTNNGTIQCNGNVGTTGGNGGSVLLNSGSIKGTFSGGANGNTGAGSNTSNISGNTFGGAGGNGGNGGSSGGTGGTVTNTAITAPRFIPQSVYGNVTTGATFAVLISGIGGGGGGGDGTNKGGGGGGGGGIVILTVFRFAGTGTIQALGGNGGNGAVGGTNCGGGGGGGGGIVIVNSNSVLSGAISGQTIIASGGTKGTASGSGVNGNDGNSGNVILVPN